MSMALSRTCRLGLVLMVMAIGNCHETRTIKSTTKARPSTTTTAPTAWPTTPWWYWTSTPHPGQDLTGRMFSVMSGSGVVFRSSRYNDINAFTVCLRVITNSMPGTVIFTLAVSNSAMLTLGSRDSSAYELTVGQASKTLRLVSEVPSFRKLWPWTSLCVTWDSTTGMTQMWKDSKMSLRQGMWRGQSFYGTPAMTLSGFEGQVTDIHMWDKALPLSSLRSYNQGWGYPSGNLLSWRDMSYSSQGYAILENAYDSQGELGGPDHSEKEEQQQQQKQRRHWRKQGHMGNVGKELPEGKQGCLGLRKRCGKKQVL